LHEVIARRVLIVGAGPAGLAVGACLRRFGVGATLLEQGAAPGWSWLERYASLRLHTTRRDSRLPRLAMRRGDRYPTAAEYAAYCATYARAFALDLRLGVEVQGLRRSGHEWRARTSRGEERAAAVVVATGRHRTPWRPQIQGAESFAGEILHSSDYRSGERFRGRRVLVAGGGNTAMDLVQDLDAHGALPLLSVRGPLHWMRRDLGPLNWHWRLRASLAALAACRRVPGGLGERLAGATAAAAMRRRFGDLAGRGLPLARGDEILARLARERPPTIDRGVVALLRRGTIPIYGELLALQATTALCARPATPAGDSPTIAAEADAVVLATGYQADPGALFSAPASAADGAYFAGGTPLLSAIRREAPRLARRIAATLPT
jgi:cation diffusion facilitator CzcD-associated flavoprotein CzcO